MLSEKFVFTLFLTKLTNHILLGKLQREHLNLREVSETFNSEEAFTKEEVLPSPYSFNIKTGAAYGTKVTREEVGDSEGRVKGTYTVSGPRGATRVVQYQADDTGFHANIKTSEPNIKTHSPSNARIEAISTKGILESGINKPKVRISNQALPRPQITAQSLPEVGHSDDIIQLNRLLMQKQNEDELRYAVSGVLNSDLEVDKFSLSAEDLKGISKRLEADKDKSLLLSMPLNNPNQVHSGNIGREIISSSMLTRVSSDALNQRLGSSVMRVTDERKRGGLRVKSGDQLLESKEFAGLVSTAQLMKDGQQVLDQAHIDPPVEIQQNVEPSFPAVSTIKKTVNKITQVKESNNRFSNVEQSKVTQTVLAGSSPASHTFHSTLGKDDANQLQVKVDDVLEQSRLSKAPFDATKQNTNRPPVQSKLVLEKISQKYLQEKVPITIPGYVPPPSFMSPFNYRVPQIRTPIMQQQERLDQILV
ncbi:ATP-grasp domain-containing protein [Nephila pilipes]|uniref:ATP-grasp domain-containing protein n=1 Tax=Nephila pilipes TaxID=299642 RepID=A0A8X6NA54_NEPPI|nr:ATP-grasp domain-containing protein [Nephila pilipes]